jgi:hypothetical protein
MLSCSDGWRSKRLVMSVASSVISEVPDIARKLRELYF